MWLVIRNLLSLYVIFMFRGSLEIRKRPTSTPRSFSTSGPRWPSLLILFPHPFPVFDFMMSCGCNLCISSRNSPAFYTAKTISIKGTNMKMRIKLHQLAPKNYKPGKCYGMKSLVYTASTTAHVYLGSRPLSSPSLRS